MARRGGWQRLGRKRFRYVDSRGKPVTDEEALERIRELVIPPAWTGVWISPYPRARLQATGIDAAGRKQYRYHASFRAAQERAKFERLSSSHGACHGCGPERRATSGSTRTSTTGPARSQSVS